MMALAALRREQARAAWAKGCGVCRRDYDALAWKGLPAVSTLPPDSVQAHLSVPAGWSVELRRCTCGAVLAMRVV
jgi:hypothetical protein